MFHEPVAGEGSGLWQGAGLSEEVGGAGNDFEGLGGVVGQEREGLLIEFEDEVIGATHDEEGGGVNAGESQRGQVWTAAAGNDGLNEAGTGSGGEQSGGGAGAGAEVAEG